MTTAAHSDMSDPKVKSEGTTQQPADDLSKSEASINNTVLDSSTVELAPSPHSAGHPISNFESVVHLVKGNIGTGIFALPSAFKNGGLFFSLAALPVIGMICIHCMHLLTNVAEELVKQTGEFSTTYALTVENGILIGEPRCRKYAKPMRIAVNIFTAITQFGFCCVYILFIGQSIKEFVDHFAGPTFDARIYMVIITIPLIFLNWIRDLKWLSPVSFAGNFFLVFTVVVMFVYVFQDLPPIDTVPAFGSWAGLPLFFGTVLFTYEGIALVLPIHKEMKTPKSFTGFFGIMNLGMIGISTLYVAVAFFGYWRYNDQIRDSIILNLPEDSIIAQTTKILLALSICSSYAVQFFVPLPFIIPALLKVFKCCGSGIAAENFLRTIIVLITCGLAVAIPHLDLFITLVGAVGCTALALIVPPTIHMMVFWRTSSWWVIGKNCLIFLFGIIGAVLGTYSSISAIIDALYKDSHPDEFTSTTALPSTSPSYDY